MPLRLLPALLHDPDLVYREPARDGSDGTDLVFARQFDDGRLYRLATRRQRDEERVRLTTVHRVQLRKLKAASGRGEALRDRHDWWLGGG